MRSSHTIQYHERGLTGRSLSLSQMVTHSQTGDKLSSSICMDKLDYAATTTEACSYQQHRS